MQYEYGTHHDDVVAPPPSTLIELKPIFVSCVWQMDQAICVYGFIVQLFVNDAKFISTSTPAIIILNIQRA